jgi:hypothetical protein
MTKPQPHLFARRLLDALFHSQSEAARELGFSDRQVRNWCRAGMPPHVELILSRLSAGEITIKHARRILRTRRQRRRLT